MSEEKVDMLLKDLVIPCDVKCLQSDTGETLLYSPRKPNGLEWLAQISGIEDGECIYVVGKIYDHGDRTIDIITSNRFVLMSARQLEKNSESRYDRNLRISEVKPKPARKYGNSIIEKA